MAQFSHSTEGGAVRSNPALTPVNRCSFAPIQSTLPSIQVSQRRLKQLEAIHLVREQREQGKQDLAFHARPFVLCGLPLRRLPSDQLTYLRSNGKFFLQLVAHPQYGMPYGQDRLIPIWIATLALRQRSKIVRFSTASEMLDFFHLFKDGKRYRRIMQGFQRVFAATTFFGTNDESEGKLVLDWGRFHFFDKCAAAHLSNYVTDAIMWCKPVKSFRLNLLSVISAT